MPCSNPILSTATSPSSKRKSLIKTNFDLALHIVLRNKHDPRSYDVSSIPLWLFAAFTDNTTHAWRYSGKIQVFTLDMMISMPSYLAREHPEIYSRSRSITGRLWRQSPLRPAQPRKSSSFRPCERLSILNIQSIQKTGSAQHQHARSESWKLGTTIPPLLWQWAVKFISDNASTRFSVLFINSLNAIVMQCQSINNSFHILISTKTARQTQRSTQKCSFQTWYYTRKFP